MKKIQTTNACVSIDLENLKFKNHNVEGAKTETVVSKSELFRKMYDAGLEICEIAKECESHYSFVYGVISNSREIRQVKKASVSDEIRRLADEGKKPGEIAKELNRNYSFVFGVVKKHNAAKAAQQTEETVEVKEA